MKTFKELSEDLNEAVRYNVDGKNVTKGVMLKAAVSKDITMMSGKVAYHAIMDDNGVFKITKKDFNKMTQTDLTTPKMKEYVDDMTLKTMIKSLSFSDGVEYNMWVKTQTKKPTNTMKSDYLKNQFGLSEGTIARTLAPKSGFHASPELRNYKGSAELIYTVVNKDDLKMLKGSAEKRGMKVDIKDKLSFKITGTQHGSLIKSLQSLIINGVVQHEPNYDKKS